MCWKTAFPFKKQFIVNYFSRGRLGSEKALFHLWYLYDFPINIKKMSWNLGVKSIFMLSIDIIILLQNLDSSPIL